MVLNSLSVSFEKSNWLTIFTDPALSKTPSGSTSIDSGASTEAKPSKFLFFNASQIAFSFASASGPVTTAAGAAAGLVAGAGFFAAAGGAGAGIVFNGQS